MKDQLFNRNILFSLMAVVMLLGWTAMSYGAATVSVDPATIESPAVGEQLTVNINIAGGEDVVGFDATVNFDTTALSYDASANDPFAIVGGTLFLNNNAQNAADGSIIVAGATLDGAAIGSDSTLATVTFEVIEVKASSITLTDVSIVNAAGDALEATTADGSVTVPTTEETPTEETPTEETPTEETPTEETPTEETPTEETPTEETPTEETPTEETPTEETPTEETPTEETPTEETPTEETPTEETPTEETPTEETPTEETPTEETPTEEPTVEEPTVEEPTVEEPTVEEPTVEEPTVEEPTVEEPTVEEPTVEEPTVEEPTVEEPTVEEPTVEEPTVEEPTVEEPTVEEPTVEEPTVEEPTVEEPTVEEPTVEEPTVEEPTVEEPTVEEPTVEEPTVEEPTVEEPTVEEPTVEEPTVEEPTVEEPTVEEPTVEEPTVEEPTVEEPTVEEPTVEEPTVEEPTVEEPTVEEPTVEEPTVEEPTVEEPTVVLPESQVFSITLTNLTIGEPGMGGQIFSPPIFATHAAGLALYEVGQPATEALVLLAEGGDTSGIAALAAQVNANTVVGDGMVLPGASVTVMLTADAMHSALSLATMLVSTNDAFVATTNLSLFDEAGMPISTTLELRSYDAGSEQNTERGTDIPGPVGLSAEEDPEGTNARVPTEAGVITRHAGIQLVGDIAASFAWTEPTAMLTIAPYVPAPEVVPVEPPPPLPTYDVTLEAGLNMISVPLMPTEPYTAQSLAEMLGSTVVIKLNVATQSFVGYVAGIEGGYNFGIEGGKGYIVNTPAGGTATFSGTAWSNEPAEMPTESAAAAPKISTTKSAWAFIVASDLQNKETGASYTMVAKNIRTGVTTTEKVSSENGYVSAVWADVNYKSVVEAGDKVEIALLDERGTIVSGPFQRTVQTTDIHNAFMSVQMRVGDVRPKETMLRQNFPNPFNPETWIPYQLNRDSNVTIQIFDVSGHSVRTLNLGHKSTGAYMTSSSAAYWDGKNAAGEHVSSGIYFYALQTQYFSATRRMVILK